MSKIFYTGFEGPWSHRLENYDAYSGNDINALYRKFNPNIYEVVPSQLDTETHTYHRLQITDKARSRTNGYGAVIANIQGTYGPAISIKSAPLLSGFAATWFVRSQSLYPAAVVTDHCTFWTPAGQIRYRYYHNLTQMDIYNDTTDTTLTSVNFNFTNHDSWNQIQAGFINGVCTFKIKQQELTYNLGIQPVINDYVRFKGNITENTAHYSYIDDLAINNTVDDGLGNTGFPNAISGIAASINPNTTLYKRDNTSNNVSILNTLSSSIQIQKNDKPGYTIPAEVAGIGNTIKQINIITQASNRTSENSHIHNSLNDQVAPANLSYRGQPSLATFTSEKVVDAIDDYTFWLDRNKYNLEDTVNRSNPDLWLQAKNIRVDSSIAWEPNGSDTGLGPSGSGVSPSDGNGGDRPFTAVGVVYLGGNGCVFGSIGELASDQWSWAVTVNSDIRMFIVDSWTGSKYMGLSHTAALTAGKWYQVAMVYDGSQTLAGMKLYLSEMGVDTTPQLLIDGGNPATYVDLSVGVYGQANEFDQLNIARGDPATILTGTANKYDQFIFMGGYAADTTVLADLLPGISNSTAVSRGFNWLQYATHWYDFKTPYNFGRNSAEESHAVSLDGVADSLTLSDTTKLSFGDGVSDQPFSLVGWVNASTVTNFVPISKDNNTLREYVIRFVSGKIHFYLVDTAGGLNVIGRLYDTVLSSNTWYHFVCTYDGLGLSSGIKIYLNGARVDDLDYNFGTYSVMDNKAIEFTIGKQGTVGAPSKVDEIAVYSGELDETTHGEVSTLYNGGTVAPARTLLPVGNTATLISDWSFNGQDVAYIGKDSYGSNDLTPVSIVEADLVGGVKDARVREISITYSAANYLRSTSGDFGCSDGVGGDQAFSVSFWVNLTDTNNTLILCSGDDFTGNNISWLLWNDTGRFSFLIHDSSATPITRIGVKEITGSISSGWNHIVLEYDGNASRTGMRIYKNGTLIVDGNDGGLHSNDDFGVYVAANSANSLTIGGINNWTQGYTIQQFSNLSFWNTNSIDVAGLQALGRNGLLSSYGGSKTNLVAWYDFENSADLGKDSHTGGLDLTVNGTPTVGPARELSNDLQEVGISSSQVTQGIIEGINEHSHITTWSDRSQLSGGDFTQTVTANQPTWTFASLGGREGLQFNGSSDRLQNTVGAKNIFDEEKVVSFVLKPGVGLSTGDYMFLMYEVGGWKVSFVDVANDKAAIQFEKYVSGGSQGTWKTTTTPLHINTTSIVQIQYKSQLGYVPRVFVDSIDWVTELQMQQTQIMTGTPNTPESGTALIGQVGGIIGDIIVSTPQAREDVFAYLDNKYSSRNNNIITDAFVEISFDEFSTLPSTVADTTLEITFDENIPQQSTMADITLEITFEE